MRSRFVMKFLQKGVLLLFLFSCVQQTTSERSDEEEVLPPQSGPAITSENMENKCSYANESSTLGMGLILAPEKFTLYNDSGLTDGFADIDMRTDDEVLIPVCPKFFMPEYGIMYFVGVDSTETAYKILADSSLIKFIGKNSGAEFTTWENYILSSFGIRRLTENEGGAQVQNDLKVSPLEESAVLPVPEGFEMFCPMEIRGSWVKVKYDCFYNTDNNPHEGEPCHNFIDDCQDPLTGWVKWKDGNNLLIDIFLMP